MKQRTKVILSTIGILLGLGIIVVIAGGSYLYLSYQSKNGSARASGEEFGKTTDQTGCVDESLRQFREFKENTFFTRIEQMHVGFFTTGCLTTARETKDFCEGAPKPTEFLHSMEWTIAKCRSAGVSGDGPCNEIFKAVIKKCSTKKPDTVSYPK